MVNKSIIIVSAFISICFLVSCQALDVQSPTLPEDELKILFNLRDRAESDGKRIKEIMAQTKEHSFSTWLKGLVGKDPSKKLDTGKEKHDEVALTFNDTISKIQGKVLSGERPSNYRAELEPHIQDVKSSQEELHAYVVKNFGRTKGIGELVTSKAVLMIIDKLKGVWEAKKEEMRKERQELVDALEQEKMEFL